MLKLGVFAVMIVGLGAGVVPSTAQAQQGDELLRLSYKSAATGQRREYFVYLPRGFNEKVTQAWPVMLFLHGNGERGNGLDELDYVLAHGPLMEAWIQRRPLPFIIISPQLPLFGETAAIEGREGKPKPARLSSGVPPRNYGFPSRLPIERTGPEDFPDGPYKRFEPYPNLDRLPAGWDRIDDELVAMVDTVLASYQGDPDRVYLTGLSMGGFGAFHLAAKYPERWAAVSTMVATGKLETAQTLAQARLPLWMFGGAKDTLVKPHWLYEMANALEEAGHPAFRFTMHEDMDHDAWKRVYEGEDIYQWMLRYRISQRPSAPEKTQ